jgi:hypothetical protein
MGDRRMAEIRTDEGSLYFYTHWSGHRLVKDAESALQAAEPRKGDNPYALRIVVDQLIKHADSRDSTLNSGLMFTPNCEDEYGGNPTSVLIDMENWKVERTGR